LMLASLAPGRTQPRGNELERYVTMARSAGQSDEQIRRNAVAAGWGETAVTDAIRSARQNKSALRPRAAAPVAGPVASVRTEGIAQKLPANPDATPGIPGETPHISRTVPYDYQIGAGDVLKINVWREPEASVPSTVVRPDGKISLPLISDVSVVGLTPKQAEV